MISFTTTLHDDLQRSLDEHGTTYDMDTVNKKLETSREFMDRLKVYIQGYTFKNDDEEILFFKKIKHKFYVPLIYYIELVYLFSNMPAGDKRVRIAYFRQIIDSNNNFIERNKVLSNYQKIGRNNEDELIFLRRADCQPLYSEYHGEIDESFCTVSSSIISKLLAFEKLNGYLSEEIDRLKFGKNIVLPEPEQHKSDALIKWHGSKAELIELIYAVHAQGSFGDIPISKVMESFERLLKINLGNFYRSFQDLSMRKKSRTPYLNSLITSIEKKFDESY
jgi:hypothetical protein